MTTSVLGSSLELERLWTISLMDEIVPFLQELIVSLIHPGKGYAATS
jgi:hypothetical protein